MIKKNPKSLGLFLNPNAPNTKPFLDQFTKFLNKFTKFLDQEKIQYLINESDLFSDLEDQKIIDIVNNVDILVSIGGDGTFLGVARKTFKYQKPLIGINFGRLGFLTPIKTTDFKQDFRNIFSGKFSVNNRLMLEIIIEGQSYYALNDLVVRNKYGNISSISLYINNMMENYYRADGLIVSTPTGSTGYNLSCNGPIVYSNSDHLVFTPICPHSLTQRPFVITSSFDMRLEVSDNCCLAILDGQKKLAIKKDCPIHIKRSILPLKSILFRWTKTIQKFT